MSYDLHPITGDYDDLTESEIAALRTSLTEAGLLVPIVIWNSQIVDGRHRERLCEELRILPSYNDITEVCPTEEKMRLYVAGLNEHRRSRTTPLTAEEKRAKAAAALKADPARSDVAIHEELGDVSQPTVNRVRRELEETGVIPRTTPANRRSRTGKVGEGQKNGRQRTRQAKRQKAREELQSKLPETVVTKPAAGHQGSAPLMLADRTPDERVDCVLRSAIMDLADAIRSVEPETVAAAVGDDVDLVLDEVRALRVWLNQFATALHGLLVAQKHADTAKQVAMPETNASTATGEMPDVPFFLDRRPVVDDGTEVA